MNQVSTAIRRTLRRAQQGRVPLIVGSSDFWEFIYGPHAVLVTAMDYRAFVQSMPHEWREEFFREKGVYQ